MDNPEAPRPTPAPLPPPSGRAQVGGFFLGVVGMAFYLAGVQFAWRDKIEFIPVNDNIKVWQYAPVFAAVGCMFFCAAIALIWRLTLKRLILIVFLAGFMVWGVSQVGLATGAGLLKQITSSYDDPPVTTDETTPASDDK